MEIIRNIIHQSLDFITDKLSNPLIGGVVLLLIIFITLVNSAGNR
ncbi:hypothetical protein ACF91D_29460 [Staphylococcus sp. 231237_7MaSpsaltlick]